MIYNILIVDNCKYNRYVLKLLLNNELDCKIDELKDCIFIDYDKFNYDIIFIDLDTPISDGFESCKKTKDLFKNTKIVALTSHANCKTISGCLKFGFDKILIKPYDIKELHNIINNLIFKQITMQK